METARSTENSESLRDRILRIAGERFAKRGFEATSVREVATAAGCTKPAMYYHFASKEELFREVVRRHVDELTAMIGRGLARPGTVRERIETGMEEYFRDIQANPVSMRLLMTCEHPTRATPEVDLQSVIRLHASLIGGLLEEGVRSGELRGDLPIEDAVWMLIGMVDIHVRQWHVGDVALGPDLARRVTDLMFRGIGS